MTTWLGQLVITKASRPGQGAFRVQYWRTPSITPALLTFQTEDDLHRYLRHTRLSGTTPDQVLEEIKKTKQLTLTTLESEEAVGGQS
jgi:hypothetical protein